MRKLCAEKKEVCQCLTEGAEWQPHGIRFWGSILGGIFEVSGAPHFGFRSLLFLSDDKRRNSSSGVMRRRKSVVLALGRKEEEEQTKLSCLALSLSLLLPPFPRGGGGEKERANLRRPCFKTNGVKCRLFNGAR